MARRRIVEKPRPEYEFASVAECEESSKYGGNHRIEVTQWPPKAQHGEERPSLSARCTRCGGWCIVYGDNDPNESAIEVVPPERKAKEALPA